ncbi:MGMT family protein [Pedobacter sp. P351]|uniref:MGMT family protein n=1 Tax=Pedobacter superstes TaxID=3133441 RepID=UPI0030A8B1C0
MDKDTFFDRVYEVARLIPLGRVTSYGAIAEYLGTKGSSRMVGYAMNASSTAKPPVPAHRVVNRFGMLSGKSHFPSPGLMEEMLKSEGIEVEDDIIKDFGNLFWDPNKELTL